MHNGQHEEQEVPIRKGVPLPGDGRGRPAKTKWPFAKLDIDDSFIIAFGTRTPTAAQRYASSMAGTAGRRLGRKFATRMEAGGIGVWRVE